MRYLPVLTGMLLASAAALPAAALSAGADGLTNAQVMNGRTFTASLRSAF